MEGPVWVFSEVPHPSLWSALNKNELQTIFTFSFSDIWHGIFCSPLSSCAEKGVKEAPSSLAFGFASNLWSVNQSYFEVNAKIYLFKTGRSPKLWFSLYRRDLSGLTDARFSVFHTPNPLFSFMTTLKLSQTGIFHVW